MSGMCGTTLARYLLPFRAMPSASQPRVTLMCYTYACALDDETPLPFCHPADSQGRILLQRAARSAAPAVGDGTGRGGGAGAARPRDERDEVGAYA